MVTNLSKKAYVYVIYVDGIARYVGKGTGERYWHHFAMANRIIKQRENGEKIRTFKFYNRLVKAILNEATFEVKILGNNLSDKAAFELEIKTISRYRKENPGQLWNVLVGGNGWTSETAKKFQPNKRINLIGKKVGRWLILKRRKSDNFHFCRCSCGTKRWVSGSNLRKGLTRSCGCLQKEKAAKSQSVTNMIGQRFTHLLVLKRMPKVKCRRGLRWLCQCDCGNEVTLYGGALRSKNTRSCGCFRVKRLQAYFKSRREGIEVSCQ